MSGQRGGALSVEAFTGDEREWNAFVACSAGGTAFHRHEYGDVIATEFAHQVDRLCVRRRDGALDGVLQLVHVRSPLFGRFLISMPFASYGGPLGTADAVWALAAAADATALKRGVDLMELRSAVPLALDLEVSHRKVTMVLPLVPGDADAVFSAFKGKLRSQVRRPEKAGVVVREGTDQVDAFYEVFAHHMRDLGTPSLPRSWFRALASAFADDFWVSVAWLNDRPIAGGAGFRWRDEFEITWASALREFNAESPNMAVYWALISRASRERLARFNFGRCTPGSSTHRFKAQWGAVETPLHWYRGRAGALDATPGADSPKHRLASQVWSRLPLTIANALGPRIVRYIP